jgi:hypothetical protein
MACDRPVVCVVAALVAVSIGFSSPADAQVTPAGPHDAEPRFVFSLGTGFVRGPSEPVAGDGIGYNGFAGLETRTPLRPLRLRVDGVWADWGHGQSLVTSATTLLVAPTRVAPYVLASGSTLPTDDYAVGWSLGAGVRFPVAGSRLFLETRMFANRRTDDRAPNDAYGRPMNRWRYFYAPVTLGVQF